MKTAVFIVAATLLCGPTLRSQDLSLVEPGDVLAVTFVPVKIYKGPLVTKAVQVTSEGKIAPPSVGGIGIKLPDIEVQGLSMSEVSELVQKEYLQHWPPGKIKAYPGPHLTVERGTVDQLFGQ